MDPIASESIERIATAQQHFERVLTRYHDAVRLRVTGDDRRRDHMTVVAMGAEMQSAFNALTGEMSRALIKAGVDPEVAP